jgi:hypothetical protein
MFVVPRILGLTSSLDIANPGPVGLDRRQWHHNDAKYLNWRLLPRGHDLCHVLCNDGGSLCQS